MTQRSSVEPGTDDLIGLGVDEILATTRAVRRRLDLERPVLAVVAVDHALAGAVAAVGGLRVRGGVGALRPGIVNLTGGASVVAALSPLVRSAADGKAFQEVVAVADGAWDVELKVGGETETKRVLTGETTERIMQPFRVAGFWDLWLWPAEPSFSAASGLATVSVAYPDRELAWMMDGAGGVFIMFVIVAFIIGGAAIKVFDIQI
mgnify:CR=1 FL=1